MKTSPERAHVVAALTEACAATSSLDDQYDLLAAWGQAVRFTRGTPDAQIAILIETAEARWGGDPDALAAFDAAAFILDLEAALDDPDLPDVELFTMLLDLDGHACAAGVIDADVSAVLDQAALLLDLYRERVAPMAAAARTFIDATGIGAEDVERAIWQCVADAAESVPAMDLLGPSALDAILDAQAHDGVLVLLRPGAHEDDRAWTKAANDGFAPEADATPLADGDGWELVLEAPGPALEVALYAAPDAGLRFEAEADGAPLPVVDDSDGRRAVVVPDGSHLTVRVGDRVLRMRAP